MNFIKTKIKSIIEKVSKNENKDIFFYTKYNKFRINKETNIINNINNNSKTKFPIKISQDY